MATLPSFDLDFSQRQMLAMNTLLSDDIDELMYGGAKGGGKTVWFCTMGFVLTKLLIKQFGLKPPKSANKIPVLGFLGRKQAVDFDNTSLRTWKTIIPFGAYEIKKQEKLIVVEGTAAIQYGGLDDSSTINKFNSAEYSFFGLDQAEEVDRDSVAMLRATLRQKINGQQPKYKAMFTANPAICWLKGEFITGRGPRRAFVKALPSDNPFLAEGYINTLTAAYGHNPSLLQAYLYGSWDDLDAAFTVIPSSAIQRCVNSNYIDRSGEKRVTVADIAEDGSDETVIYDWKNYTLDRSSIEIYTHRDLMDTCGRIQAHARKNGSNMICVDKVGLGAGVFSRLNEIYSQDESDLERTSIRVTVYGFDGRIEAPGPLNEQTFKNYKSWAWFKARERMKEGRLDIPDDEVLRSQLAGVTWKFTSGEVIMLDKNEDIKERLGSSPDRATTVIMGIDAIDRAQIVKRHDAYARPQFHSRMRHRRRWALA